MLPNYQARSIFVLKYTTSWRASEASETVLGVDNAKSGICYIYVCMYGWMVRMPFKRARGELILSKKHGFLGLTPFYSETTVLSKPYFILKRRIVRKLLRKRLLFKKQKVDSTGYYGIEDPFPDLISKLRRFMGGYGVPIVGCQEPLVVRMP